MASHYFLCEKNHSTKHFGKYNEFITIWYGLGCNVFGTSKVQYVMVTQNLFMKSIQCNHITCNIYFWNLFHILFVYILLHGPWLSNKLRQDYVLHHNVLLFYSTYVFHLKGWQITKMIFKYLINVLRAEINSNW
jgi:hypothetical protein